MRVEDVAQFRRFRPSKRVADYYSGGCNCCGMPPPNRVMRAPSGELAFLCEVCFKEWMELMEDQLVAEELMEE